MSPLQEEILSTSDVAKLLAVDPATVGDWVDQNKLAAYKTPGGHHRIRKEDFLKFLESYKIPVPPSLSPAQKTLLVVDDEPGIRASLKWMIHEIYPDFLVEEAEDGYQAGRKLSRLKPQLVLLDLNMSGVDGLQICGDIRRDPAIRAMKIIVMTGDGLPETREKALKAGADAVLVKPFEFDVFQKHLDTFITVK